MTTPYYSDEFVTLYHGDCLDLLPHLTADAVVMDPPYGNGTNYDGFDDTPDAVRSLMAEALPMARIAAPVAVVTCGVGRIHDYPPPEWTLAWFAPGGTGSGPWGFTCWQPVLAYGKDPYLKAGKGRRPDAFMAQFKRGVVANPRYNHPCPKPLRAMRWLVERATVVEGATVLDPFAGSGTTLEAAKSLGRKSIGIEQSEAYCEIIARRMSQGVLDFGAVS